MKIGITEEKRLLPERANMEFWYPDGKTVMFLPFFENPKISESAGANYVEYNPLARAGSLYTYTGAKSRKLRVELSYTLPDLLNYPMGISAYSRIFSSGASQAKDSFFARKSLGAPTLESSLSKEAKVAYVAFGGSIPGVPDIGVGISLQPEVILQNETDDRELDKAVDTLLLFTAMLRSSVLNNACNPIEGPPLVRLNFGTLYQSIPCIVKNYSIKWEERAGYDLDTLTPRRLLFTITLNEVRVGDFTEFDRTSITKRDNLTGWESVIETPNTMDPGNRF